MSNEHAPTGGEGATTDGESSVLGDRETREIELDALLEVLADVERRQILAYLDAADDDVAAYSDIIGHVADGVAGESTDNHEQFAVTLHHNHLPKLSGAGVVEYDERSETVRYRGGRTVSEWLDLVRSLDPDVGDP
jgi:DNA-binding transcriptional ArsR family regulator